MEILTGTYIYIYIYIYEWEIFPLPCLIIGWYLTTTCLYQLELNKVENRFVPGPRWRSLIFSVMTCFRDRHVPPIDWLHVAMGENSRAILPMKINIRESCAGGSPGHLSGQGVSHVRAENRLMIHDLDDGHGASLARFVQQLLSCSKWFLQCLHCNFATYVTSNLMYIQ